MSKLGREVRIVPSPLSHGNTSGDTNSSRRWGQLGRWRQHTGGTDIPDGLNLEELWGT